MKTSREPTRHRSHSDEKSENIMMWRVMEQILGMIIIDVDHGKAKDETRAKHNNNNNKRQSKRSCKNYLASDMKVRTYLTRSILPGYGKAKED